MIERESTMPQIRPISDFRNKFSDIFRIVHVLALSVVLAGCADL
jgi:hypothetical protein